MVSNNRKTEVENIGVQYTPFNSWFLTILDLWMVFYIMKMVGVPPLAIYNDHAEGWVPNQWGGGGGWFPWFPTI